MLNLESAKHLYTLVPDVRLPPAAQPYCAFLKPLQAFFLTALDLGNPSTFVPLVTAKASFELFISTYLGDSYAPLELLASNDSSRKEKRLLPLGYSSRAKSPGQLPVLTIPYRSFASLISGVLGSKSFREAFRAQVAERFAAGEISAAQSVLMPEFVPGSVTLSVGRVPVIMNAGLLPVSRVLPDKILSIADARFDGDPALSRSTFPRFKPSEQAATFLPENELYTLNATFDSVSRAASVAAKRNVSRYQAKYATLLESGIVKADDPKFLDQAALDSLRMGALRGPSAQVDTFPTE